MATALLRPLYGLFVGVLVSAVTLPSLLPAQCDYGCDDPCAPGTPSCNTITGCDTGRQCAPNAGVLCRCRIQRSGCFCQRVN